MMPIYPCLQLNFTFDSAEGFLTPAIFAMPIEEYGQEDFSPGTTSQQLLLKNVVQLGSVLCQTASR